MHSKWNLFTDVISNPCHYECTSEWIDNSSFSFFIFSFQTMKKAIGFLIYSVTYSVDIWITVYFQIYRYECDPFVWATNYSKRIYMLVYTFGNQIITFRKPQRINNSFVKTLNHEAQCKYSQLMKKKRILSWLKLVVYLFISYLFHYEIPITIYKTVFTSRLILLEKGKCDFLIFILYKYI